MFGIEIGLLNSQRKQRHRPYTAGIRSFRHYRTLIDPMVNLKGKRVIILLNIGNILLNGKKTGAQNF